MRLVRLFSLSSKESSHADITSREHGGNEAVPGGAGQNMASSVTSGATASQSGSDIIGAFMDEEKDYDPKNPIYSHFTQ